MQEWGVYSALHSMCKFICINIFNLEEAVNSHPETKWKLKNTWFVQDGEILSFPSLSFHSFYCLQTLNSLATDRWRLGKCHGENILHSLTLSLVPRVYHKYPLWESVRNDRILSDTDNWCEHLLILCSIDFMFLHRLKTAVIGENLQLLATVILLSGLLTKFIHVKSYAIAMTSMLIDSKYL